MPRNHCNASHRWVVFLAVVGIGLALSGRAAQAGVVLAGAPGQVASIAASGKMPQPRVVYDFQWTETCGAIDAPGCTLVQEQLTLDPALLLTPSAMIETGIGNGVPLMQFVLFHELGHVFDRELMTDATRAAFMELIGRTDGWWSAADGAPPEELFADAYALCSIYGAAIPRDTLHPVGYAWKPTMALQRQSCGIVISAGGIGSANTRAIAT